MPTEDSEAPSIPHFEDVNAPIVYADWCWGGGAVNGENLTLTFVTKILNHTENPPASHTKTVLRLVIPKIAASAMADFIKNHLANIEAGHEMAATNKTLN